MLSLLCSFENSATEETHINWFKKLKYFYIQDTLLAMGDKRKHIKKLYVGKEKKAWNKPTKPSPNKWKRKLAKSNKGL